ncbi:MAG: hypothetical protein GKS07_06165 [Nitrosopumilus sp.]|nr:MAG: hypothetical protein GKS07_06165 [Nitrosopumilus sp.]
MSKTSDKPNNLFTECKERTEEFFSEIEKSTPIYHQTATDIQQNFLESWKNVIFSSITLQQEFAAKAGLNVNTSKETRESIRNITRQAVDAYQSQNKFTVDSNNTTNNMFEAFNENTKTFASLSKNILELMSSAMKKT